MGQDFAPKLRELTGESVIIEQSCHPDGVTKGSTRWILQEHDELLVGFLGAVGEDAHCHLLVCFAGSEGEGAFQGGKIDAGNSGAIGSGILDGDCDKDWSAEGNREIRRVRGAGSLKQWDVINGERGKTGLVDDVARGGGSFQGGTSWIGKSHCERFDVFRDSIVEDGDLNQGFELTGSNRQRSSGSNEVGALRRCAALSCVVHGDGRVCSQDGADFKFQNTMILVRSIEGSIPKDFNLNGGGRKGARKCVIGCVEIASLAGEIGGP